MAKKKILLLSDDLRMASGIATMSKQFVLGTLKDFDWVQVGAAVKHPEEGKIMDLCDDVRKRTGIEDAYVKIYPSSGYGTPESLRQIINMENPDAILHFTDPRYWIWLYQIEHEIRQNIPILFYHIWDDLPDPKYNRDYLESCDWVGTISKQTYGITRRVWGMNDKSRWKQPADWQVKYVPHGINGTDYKPTEIDDKFYKEVLGDKKYDFVAYWSNRNIRRKQAIDVIVSFRDFVNNLPEEKRDKCALLMHTQKVDENGTDLPKVVADLCPGINVIFDDRKWNEQQLNQLYNIADVTLNISSAEGFGLASAESIVAGTPVIVNVTGGLQDQCGFRWKDSGVALNEEDYVEIGSLHDWRKYEDKVTWGDWVIPIWSRSRSYTGSPPTPYIMEDHVDTYEVTSALNEFYNMSRDERKALGLKGREWALGEGGLSLENMCKTMTDGINDALENFTPRKKHEIFTLDIK
jgi:glycosyltransferase involved in cell wall biosynthesis